MRPGQGADELMQEGEEESSGGRRQWQPLEPEDEDGGPAWEAGPG